MFRRSRPRPERKIAARLVLLLGGAAAVALVRAAFLDLGDPRTTAMTRLEAEAESEGTLVIARWRARMSSADWLAETVDARRISGVAPYEPAAPLRESTTEDEIDRVRIVALRAAAARDDADEVRDQAGVVIARGGARSGEALLELVRFLRRSDGPAAGDAYLQLASGVPWNAAVDGTSGRLLALLSAAPSLAAEARETCALECVAALREGVVALPAPVDRATVAPTGFVLTPDPWWGALCESAKERLGVVDWSIAFREPVRADAAIASTLEEITPGHWNVRRVDDGTWLAARENDGRLHVAVHTSDALSASVAGLGIEGQGIEGQGIEGQGIEWQGLTAVAFAERPDLTDVVTVGRLMGTEAILTIAHPDPDAVIGREQQRLDRLRAGLLALALLVLVTTAAASRLIARSRELERMRSTFVASVSHDLRTPLASISLLAENLSSGYAKGSEDRYVDAIRRETGRLGRLVDDLLDFGRIERGLLPNVTRVEVDVQAWLDEFEARERARCAAGECALSVERGELPATARLDVGALERALSNLIDNALVHADTDAIRLRVRAENGGLLAFEVEDAGRGLPRGVVHEQLFQPFRRGEESGGTGLGLAIVRAIAEAHGGDATLAPGPNGAGLRATVRVDGEEDAA